jgi:hypothetical protein
MFGNAFAANYFKKKLKIRKKKKNDSNFSFKNKS